MLQELQGNLLISGRPGSWCGQMYLDSDQFCTGAMGDPKTSCNGDSGGPITIGVSLKIIELNIEQFFLLIQVGNGLYQQLGLVSNGPRGSCDEPWAANTNVFG